MHIVILTPSYFPLCGGTELTIRSWATRLATHHQVSIVTLRHDESPHFETLAHGIALYRVATSTTRGWEHLVRAASVLRCLVRIRRQSPIDLLHLGHVYHIGLGTILFKLLTKTPLVTTLLGWDTYDPLTPVHRYYHPYLAFVMNRSDRMVTMTRHMAASARSQGCRHEITLIPHGSDMFGRKATFSLRERYGIDADAPVLFSLQRLHPRKGLTYLIEAVPQVLAQTPEAVFLIAGKGPQESELKEMVRQRGLDRQVRLIGFVADDDLATCYLQATLFVLPSLYEGFGIVYVDALALGCPVVTTSNGGALDIVTETSGVLVPPSDAPALAGGILSALKTAWDRPAIADYARRFEWDGIVAHYEKIYAELYTSRTGQAG